MDSATEVDEGTFNTVANIGFTIGSRALEQANLCIGTDIAVTSEEIGSGALVQTTVSEVRGVCVSPGDPVITSQDLGFATIVIQAQGTADHRHKGP